MSAAPGSRSRPPADWRWREAAPSLLPFLAGAGALTLALAARAALLASARLPIGIW